MKPFLFSYTPGMGSTDSVLAWLNMRIEIARWMTPPMPSTVIILSDQTVGHLADIVRKDFPGEFFFITELSIHHYAGSLPNVVWAEIARGVLEPSLWQTLFGPQGLLDKSDFTKGIE